MQNRLDFGVRHVSRELHSSALTPKHKGREPLSGLAVTLPKKQSADPPPFVCAVACRRHFSTKLLNALASM